MSYKIIYHNTIFIHKLSNIFSYLFLYNLPSDLHIIIIRYLYSCFICHSNIINNHNNMCSFCHKYICVSCKGIQNVIYDHNNKFINKFMFCKICLNSHNYENLINFISLK